MKRLGISIVSTVVHDLETPLKENPVLEFDRILLDAPCSGLGVLRRNPDTKWSALPQHVIRLQARQKRFLARLATLVRPGGTLVYAVCSTEPEEGELVIKDFLNNHPEFAIKKAFEAPAWKTDPPLLDDGRLRPSVHRHHMDGFFAVAMVRSCSVVSRES
jgi:16S rRNA (cytosine967-C5)-methyltransferase